MIVKKKIFEHISTLKVRAMKCRYNLDKTLFKTGICMNHINMIELSSVILFYTLESISEHQGIRVKTREGTLECPQ